MTSYREAGVDTALKAATLARLRERVRPGRPEVLGGIGGFGGLFRAPTGKDLVLVATTDGVGTKTELARLLGRYEVIGTDVVHQSVNDALAVGAEPLFFLDYFATSHLDAAIFDRVIDAVAAACEASGCALLGGETAEMPGVFAEGAFDVVGFLVGAVERERLLEPASAREGDVLVGIPSTGLHTNGYTLARAIVARLAEREGRTVEETLRAPRSALTASTGTAGAGTGAAPIGAASTRAASVGTATAGAASAAGSVSLADALLAPHRSYLAEVRALRAAAEVRSIAHLTGGGWEGNLPRALAEGLGAAVRCGAWTVPPLFTFLGNEGGVAEAERFATWNMGIGLVAVVPPASADAALAAVSGAVRLGEVERPRPGGPRVRFL